ncbi:MAG TPA: tetratricopeptide repeat protein [Pirellulales bacterium]|jgi:tetratricopeptide (TPR) repeat protein|nr:tetratricopeptide repeat protein [Pirellulales bacterium]
MSSRDSKAPLVSNTLAAAFVVLGERVGRFCALLLISLALVAIGAPLPRQVRAEEDAATDPAKVEAKVLELLAGGDQAKAEAILREELVQFPETLEVAGLLMAGKPKEAEDLLNANLAKIQKGQRIFFLFGCCERSRFDVQSANLLFSIVLKMGPTTPAGNCALLVVRLDSPRLRQFEPKKADEAFATLDKLADANPDDVVIRWMAAVECRHWNRNAEGVEHYKKILEKWNPGPSLVHQTYANLLDQLGRLEDALVERKQVVKMEPAGWSYDGLGSTLQHLHRYKEANDAYAAAVRLSPDRALHWTNWAVSLKDEEEFDKAIEKCQHATELKAREGDDDAWRPWSVWGEILEIQRQPEEALEKYKEALSLAPENPGVKKKVADLEARLGK